MIAVHIFHAREASMGTTDNFFFAYSGPNLEDNAFENNRFGPQNLPNYRFGVVGYGRFGGVVGCGGTAIQRPLNSYSVNVGVHGTSRDFSGVAGTSLTRVGVYGQVEAGFALPTILHAGVLGAAETQPGVIGFSIENDGVQGQSFSRGSFGVSGRSNSGYGVYGFSNDSVGVFAETGNPTGYAGFFNGNVAVNGRFIAASKQAVVPFPDGTQRVLVCMESPEHWFEDFGAAKLTRGRAIVKLDADFAKVIKRDYRVFITPEGDCRGLYVRRKGAANFEVRELMGGKSSIAFSYRIAGRRKDINGHRRFAKFDMPMLLPAQRGGDHSHCVRLSATWKNGRVRRRRRASEKAIETSRLSPLRKYIRAAVLAIDETRATGKTRVRSRRVMYSFPKGIQCADPLKLWL
jgi:hypothetical protein